MKKLFLFMLVSSLTLSLHSCSEDNNSTPTGSSLTMKVGGVQKTFNTITVNEIPYDDYVDLIITASNNGSTSEFVTFGIGKGDMGTGHAWGFEYTLNDVVYTESAAVKTISSNATTNSDNKLVGTFSGTVTSSENATIELTQGSFDISY